MANVIKKHELFPTVIHEFVYSADKKLINAVKNVDLVKDNPTYNPYYTNQSINRMLHKEKDFSDLTKKILDTTHDVCEFYSYAYDSLEITNLWVNFASKGTTHNPHTHSNNLFSGVWYPFENTSQTPIMFQDPRPAAGVLLPNVKRHNKYTGSIISMQPKKGMGLFFPSWLSHYVPPSLENRISLSWNIILRGNYGEPNALQNAHI